MIEEAALREKARLGVRVAIAMAVLSVIEYIIAVNVEKPLVWLIPFVAAKGWLILDYFMHFRAFLAAERSR